MSLSKEEIKAIRQKHLKRLNRRGKKYRKLDFTEKSAFDIKVREELEEKEQELKAFDLLQTNNENIGNIPKRIDFESPNFPKSLETAIEGEKKLEGQFEQSSEAWGFCQKCHCKPCICRREENV